MELVSKVSEYWQQLLKEAVPQVHPCDLEDIIKLNRSDLQKELNKYGDYMKYMDIDTLQKYMNTESNWKKQTTDYIKTVELLKGLL